MEAYKNSMYNGHHCDLPPMLRALVDRARSAHAEMDDKVTRFPVPTDPMITMHRPHSVREIERAKVAPADDGYQSGSFSRPTSASTGVGNFVSHADTNHYFGGKTLAVGAIAPGPGTVVLKKQDFPSPVYDAFVHRLLVYHAETVDRSFNNETICTMHAMFESNAYTLSSKEWSSAQSLGNIALIFLNYANLKELPKSKLTLDDVNAPGTQILFHDYVHFCGDFGIVPKYLTKSEAATCFREALESSISQPSSCEEAGSGTNQQGRQTHTDRKQLRISMNYNEFLECLARIGIRVYSKPKFRSPAQKYAREKVKAFTKLIGFADNATVKLKLLRLAKLQRFRQRQAFTLTPEFQELTKTKPSSTATAFLFKPSVVAEQISPIQQLSPKDVEPIRKLDKNVQAESWVNYLGAFFDLGRITMSRIMAQKYQYKLTIKNCFHSMLVAHVSCHEVPFLKVDYSRKAMNLAPGMTLTLFIHFNPREKIMEGDHSGDIEVALYHAITKELLDVLRVPVYVDFMAPESVAAKQFANKPTPPESAPKGTSIYLKRLAVSESVPQLTTLAGSAALHSSMSLHTINDEHNMPRVMSTASLLPPKYGSMQSIRSKATSRASLRRSTTAIPSH